MPPFITGLKTVLQALANWALYVVPVVIILTVIIGGIKLSKAEDSMEIKEVKAMMGRVIIGAGVAGSGAWIGNWLWNIMS